MKDRPFDEIAVNFAREAVKDIIDRQARCNSMKERGKVRDAETDPMIIDDSDHQYPVTIFRHRE